MADPNIESFLDSVLERTEIILSQNSGILTHVDLLDKTVRMLCQLARIVDEDEDVNMLEDLKEVFSELFERFCRFSSETTSRPSQTHPFLSLRSSVTARVDHHSSFRAS